MRPKAAIILAAGQGVRMRSSLPKPLHAVGGRAMADWAVALVRDAGCEKIVFVVSKGSDALRAYADKELGPGSWVVQDPPLGTGHAVRAAEPALTGFDGDVVVLFADSPLIRTETVAQAFAARADGAEIVIVGFEAKDPTGYGRLIETGDGAISGIVEERECTPAQRAIRLCNSGVMAGDARALFALLAQVTGDNAKGEYYLTDVARLAHEAGKRVVAVRADEEEVLGVNSRSELAEAEAAFQARARATAMEGGVTLIDPSTVYFSFDTRDRTGCRDRAERGFGSRRAH